MDDLNPITRTERLLDGEDLTPTNREEMFIKRIYDKTQEIPEPVNRKEYFLKKAGEAGGDVTVIPLSVTDNGIYSEEGKAYSPVTVEVEPPENSYQLKSITTPTPLATFEASAMPMPSLKVSVEAQQDSGTPSPSNPLPISGWDAANISDVGKNLVEETISTASVDASGKIIALNDYDIQIAKVKANETYTITSNELLVCGFYTTKPSIGSVSYNGTRLANQPKTFVAPIDGYIAFRTASAYATPQCELGSTATEYVPYVEPNLYTISLGQTVYGGEVDVVNGTSGNRLTHVIVDLGNKTWVMETWGSGIDFYTGLPDAKKPTSDDEKADIISSQYENLSRNELYNTTDDGMALLRGGVFKIRDSRFSDAASFKAAMSGVQLVYELETPTTFTTQPTPIKSLNGTNNLSVDCGDVIEGEYFIALGGE